MLKHRWAIGCEQMGGGGADRRKKGEIKREKGREGDLTAKIWPSGTDRAPNSNLDCLLLVSSFSSYPIRCTDGAPYSNLDCLILISSLSSSPLTCKARQGNSRKKITFKVTSYVLLCFRS